MCFVSDSAFIINWYNAVSDPSLISKWQGKYAGKIENRVSLMGSQKNYG